MKLKRLSIQNIASLRNVEIDFEAPPLSDAGVFLIAGETGSGKTTILDAISLALYGNTPRFSSAPKTTIEQNGEEVVLTNPNQLLRKGTAEGSATLVFEGNNGVEYEAVWSVRRSRNKLTGKMRNAERSLRKSGNYELLTGKEMKAEIEQAVGLDFDQFSRTTMLAQGDFAKFLHSDDKEKAAILEKITGTGKYARIGAMVYKIYKEKESDWELASQKVNDIRLLEPALRLSARRELGHYKMEFGLLERDREILLEKASCLKNIQECKTKIKNAESELETSSDIFNICLAGMAYEEKILKAAETRRKELKVLVEERKPVKTTLENADILSTLLMGLDGDRQAITNEKEKLEKEDEHLKKELEPKRDTVVEAAEKAKKATLKALEKWNKKKKEVKALALSALRSELEDLSKKAEQVRNVKGLIDAFETCVSLLQDGETRFKELEEEEADLIRVLKETEPEVEKARECRDKAWHEYEIRKDTADKFAQAVRARLQVGDVCPVCRQKVQVLPVISREEMENVTAESRAIYEKAEKDLKEKEGIQNKVKGAISTLTSRKESDRKEIEEAKKKVESKRKEVVRECRGLGINMEDIVPSDNVLTVKLRLSIEQLLSEFQNSEEILKKRIKTGESEEKEAESLRGLYDEAVKEEAKAKEAILEIDALLSRSKTEIAKSDSIIKTKQADAADKEARIEVLVDGDWETDWKKDPVIFNRELGKASASYKKDLDEQEKTVRLIETTKSRLSTYEENRTTVTTLVPEWKKREITESMEVSDLMSRWTSLISGVSKTVENIRLAQEEIDKKIRRLVELFGENSEEWPDTEELKKMIEETEERKRTIIDRRANLSATLLHDAENRKTLQRLVSEKDRLRQIYEKWANLNLHFGCATGAKFRLIAQRYVLENLILSANHYMDTLSGRYRLVSSQGTLTISVTDAYQGGIERTAKTLSGGESFLVSLSLALGLSEIGEKLKVETLFIDEGFGSLSGEPLQKAIGTLQTLHSKTGRHIGIISHVEELRERIPVQIRVEQESHSSSSSVRVTEI